MSFTNHDREFARSSALPSWMEEFANRELKKEGNPFDDIRGLFQQKNDVMAVEERVKELRNMVGLDKLEKIANPEDEIFGGFGDGEPDDKFDLEQLEKGIKVELEHTSDPAKAKEIAKDHLMESKDFKGEEGAKYYDRLDAMEEEIENELTKGASIKKKAMLSRLIQIANKFEVDGQVGNAIAVDELIKKMAEQLAKDKKKDVFDERPNLQRKIDNICVSRGGFIDVPAVLQMLQSGSDKFSEKEIEQLKKYISKRKKDSKREMGEENEDISSMSYVVFVVNEDDGNSDVFSGPTRM